MFRGIQRILVLQMLTILILGVMLTITLEKPPKPVPIPTTTTVVVTIPPKQPLGGVENRVVYPTHPLCPQWAEIVVLAGWSETEMLRLDEIMYRESRCEPLAHNGRDVNGGSIGLMQVNAYWCKPSNWTKNGWLQDRGILTACGELYYPLTNLKAARAIYQYSFAKHGDGWLPWQP